VGSIPTFGTIIMKESECGTSFPYNYNEAGTALTISDPDNAGAVLTTLADLLRKVSAAFY
jgi:hypothetical protein